MIILNVTKNYSFTLSVEDTFFEKPQEKVKLIPPAVLGLKACYFHFKTSTKEISVLFRTRLWRLDLWSLI